MLFATAGVMRNHSEQELDYHHKHGPNIELAGPLSRLRSLSLPLSARCVSSAPSDNRNDGQTDTPEATASHTAPRQADRPTVGRGRAVTQVESLLPGARVGRAEEVLCTKNRGCSMLPWQQDSISHGKESENNGANPEGAAHLRSW